MGESRAACQLQSLISIGSTNRAPNSQQNVIWDRQKDELERSNASIVGDKTLAVIGNDHQVRSGGFCNQGIANFRNARLVSMSRFLAVHSTNLPLDAMSRVLEIVGIPAALACRSTAIPSASSKPINSFPVDHSQTIRPLQLWLREMPH